MDSDFLPFEVTWTGDRPEIHVGDALVADESLLPIIIKREIFDAP